ncbi:MAG TPA: hypothetical protein DGB72_11565 [Gemmatimonadetes bacterium]|nr:hypothetical protein [Gemmatimonadota bacterium]
MRGSVASTPHLRRIGSVLTIGSVIAILFATMLPAPGQPMDSHLCLVCGTDGGVDFILNIILFIPLGIGLALSGIPWNRAILTACGLSVTIETVQFLFVPGRDATLGDVLTNTVGGALGFAVARNAGIWLRPTPRIATGLGLAWCTVWLTVQAISSFALAPSITDSRYYGEIAPKLGNFALFPGRVLSAKIDEVAIADTELNDIDGVRRRLIRGGTVAATVVSAGPTNDIAPIVRVADDEQREIVLLAQDEQALLFGVRTRAAILRLRPPLFAMAGVFTDSTSIKNSGVSKRNDSATDPLNLSGSYDGREARLTVRTDSASSERRVSVSSSLGWTLALPFQWSIEDTRTEHVVSWIWIACLMVPTGYWSPHIARHSDAHASATRVVLCLLGVVAILIAGLVPVQHAFGLPAAPMRDWFAAMSGILVGGAFALRGTGIEFWQAARRS